MPRSRRTTDFAEFLSSRCAAVVIAKSSLEAAASFLECLLFFFPSLFLFFFSLPGKLNSAFLSQNLTLSVKEEGEGDVAKINFRANSEHFPLLGGRAILYFFLLLFLIKISVYLIARNVCPDDGWVLVIKRDEIRSCESCVFARSGARERDEPYKLPCVRGKKKSRDRPARTPRG